MPGFGQGSFNHRAVIINGYFFYALPDYILNLAAGQGFIGSNEAATTRINAASLVNEFGLYVIFIRLSHADSRLSKEAGRGLVVTPDKFQLFAPVKSRRVGAVVIAELNFTIDRLDQL